MKAQNKDIADRILSNMPTLNGQEIVDLCKAYKKMKLALERISFAAPDYLDHTIDVMRLEKAIKIAKDAL